MSRDKQNIKTTDWLIRGIPKEQIAREKQEAIMSAYLELCITYDEETNSIDFDATAEKMVSAGYRKSTDFADEIFVETHLMLLKILKTVDEEFFKAMRQDDEITQIATVSARNAILCAIHSLAKLKKEYTEGGNECD